MENSVRFKASFKHGFLSLVWLQNLVQLKASGSSKQSPKECVTVTTYQKCHLEVKSLNLIIQTQQSPSLHYGRSLKAILVTDEIIPPFLRPTSE